MLIHGELLSHDTDVVHGFSCLGPDGRPLDLGTGVPTEAWSWVARELSLPGASVARLHQVHGDAVASVDVGGDAGMADALWTEVPGLLLAVRVADCVPVVVAGEGRVGAIHAGWRGVAAGIVPAALAAMGGAERAVVGPCICVEHYEVGEEVVAGIAEAGVPEARFVDRARGLRPHVDLRAAVAWQLESNGVSRVEVLPQCTFSDPSLPSYRRDGPRSWRMAGLIGLTPR